MYGAKTHATPHQWRKFQHHVISQQIFSLDHRVVSLPLGYGKISATRVTKSETCFRHLGNAEVSCSYMHTWKPLQHRSQMFHEWALTWSPLEADYVTIRNYI
jgi:hypothetical protein